MNRNLLATVVVPTTGNRGSLVSLAVDSILSQTVQDLEVFILGDGVSDKSRDEIKEIEQSDGRVRFFDHPKDVSRGELNRHKALQEAHGRIICYLCDRDLMLPNHVESLLDLLAGADFACTLSPVVEIDGTISIQWAYDLGVDADRQAALRYKTGPVLSSVGHTLEMYRRLPFGWRTTPAEFCVNTDLYMWHQFLQQANCRAVSGQIPTILYFPSWRPKKLTDEERLQEMATWKQQMSVPGWYETFLKNVIKAQAIYSASTNRKLLCVPQIRLYEWAIRKPLLQKALISNSLFAFLTRSSARLMLKNDGRRKLDEQGN